MEQIYIPTRQLSRDGVIEVAHDMGEVQSSHSSHHPAKFVDLVKVKTKYF